MGIVNACKYLSLYVQQVCNLTHFSAFFFGYFNSYQVLCPLKFSCYNHFYQIYIHVILGISYAIQFLVPFVIISLK